MLLMSSTLLSGRITVAMYKYIYFDLDNTLVKDNPSNGKSELLESGFLKYKELRGLYPNIPFFLFTNRLEKEIEYPNEYSFEEVIGRDNMHEYIDSGSIHPKDILSLKKLPIYLYALFLLKKGLRNNMDSSGTPKLMYLFLRHVVKGEEILVVDDDMRVSKFFK